MTFNAIIFDFNGLIVDDEPIHFECFQKVLQEEEIQLSDKDYWESYLGFDDKGLFETIFNRDGKKLTPKKLKDLIQKKNDFYFPTIEKNLKIFPGVVDFIKDVSSRFDVAVVSGALRSEIEFVLEKAGIKKCFPLIVSANDTKHGKPDPEGFVLALAQLKKKNPAIRPETCLVLEDSLAGIEAAHRARMKVVALPHTYSKEELKAADFVCGNFAEVKALIGSGVHS